jgi:flagellar hook-basal body complex protein FliE
MDKTKKAEIKESVNKALSQVLEHLKISQPSKKTTKAITKASKVLKKELKDILKKNDRKATKLAKAPKVKKEKGLTKVMKHAV